MNATIGKLRAHFTNWREWELNPIVIKELRQGVRSWSVTGMLMLFLVVLFIASLGFLITESFDVNVNMGLGGTMFSSFMVILAGASVFFIPLYTGVRVAAERQENNPDLLYVTTLSPARIIFGKFLCSAYIVVLFFSACMPFQNQNAARRSASADNRRPRRPPWPRDGSPGPAPSPRQCACPA